MALLLKTSGEASIIEPKNGRQFTLEEQQAAVGGYVEHVRAGKATMVLDEEGKLSKKPINRAATVLAYPGGEDIIVGDVLVCTRKEAGYCDE